MFKLERLPFGSGRRMALIRPLAGIRRSFMIILFFPLRSFLLLLVARLLSQGSEVHPNKGRLKLTHFQVYPKSTFPKKNLSRGA